ncbi:hypothetical protein [Bacillus subtilis]|uniref:hypothetical protein n=1 Tax=Bacillus subtilis TaxID=1423 RepID=UPI00100A11B2|nr:hypothetical protein [Bacillus subtilis]QAW06667.1 hypothetical protein ES968_22150 [Bacillus subtilis]
MDIKVAKEVIQAGFAWAKWDDRQKEAFKVAWECMTKAQQNETEPEGLIVSLRQHHQISLYTVGDQWCIQLFDLDVNTNFIGANCVYEDQNESLKKLLIYAHEWVIRNNETY